MSYSTTRKNGRICSNISRSIVVFEVALVDVSAEREDKTQGALCLCSQVA